MIQGQNALSLLCQLVPGTKGKDLYRSDWKASSPTPLAEIRLQMARGELWRVQQPPSSSTSASYYMCGIHFHNPALKQCANGQVLYVFAASSFNSDCAYAIAMERLMLICLHHKRAPAVVERTLDHTKDSAYVAGSIHREHLDCALADQLADNMQQSASSQQPAAQRGPPSNSNGKNTSASSKNGLSSFERRALETAERDFVSLVLERVNVIAAKKCRRGNQCPLVYENADAVINKRDEGAMAALKARRGGGRVEVYLRLADDVTGQNEVRGIGTSKQFAKADASLKFMVGTLVCGY